MLPLVEPGEPREPGEPDERELLTAVVREINTVRGTAFRLGRRLRTGEQGASLLHAASGERFVLKWSPGRRDLGRLPAVVATLDHLRDDGYPIPRYVAFGVLASPPGRYSIQERLPGHAVWRVEASILNQALALNDLQAGRAAHLVQSQRFRGTAFPPWRDLLPRLAQRGGRGFCQLRAMRRYSPAAARLLDHVQDYTGTHAGRLAAVPADDVVHFDFSGANLLVYKGRITGVVDWEGLTPGDRAFDLATFLFAHGYAAGVAPIRERLWRRGLELADAQTFGLYLCHMVHRQVDWSIRHHDPAMIAKVLDIGDAVLAAVARCAGGWVRPQ